MNLLVVFTLSGLWHGAAWTYVLWGVFHGVFVTLERLAGPRRERIPRVVQRVVTLALVVVGWVIFRAATAGQALDVIRAMFGFASASEPGPLPAQATPGYAMFALAIGVAVSLAPLVIRGRAWRPRFPHASHLAARLGYVAMFVMSAVHLSNMRITPLIYFKF